MLAREQKPQKIDRCLLKAYKGRIFSRANRRVFGRRASAFDKLRGTLGARAAACKATGSRTLMAIPMGVFLGRFSGAAGSGPGFRRFMWASFDLSP